MRQGERDLSNRPQSNMGDPLRIALRREVFRTEMRTTTPAVSEAIRKYELLQLPNGAGLGCHGHGFAWPCLRYNRSTATQSRDRGTRKTSHFFPDSLSVISGNEGLHTRIRSLLIVAFCLSFVSDYVGMPSTVAISATDRSSRKCRVRASRSAQPIRLSPKWISSASSKRAASGDSSVGCSSTSVRSATLRVEYLSR